MQYAGGLFHVPTGKHGFTEVFGPNSVSIGSNWAIWLKPKGVNWVYMDCIRGGGGGGGGAGGNAGANKGGGGGGSGGARSCFLYPAALVPDRLYVSVGFGGTGGNGGTSGSGSNGTGGIGTYISIHPVTTASHLYAIGFGLQSSGNPFGGGGTSAAAGTASTAAGADAATAFGFAGWPALFQSAGAQGGTIGGIHTGGAGGSLSPSTAMKILGGTGGGGVAGADTAGGAITADGVFLGNPGGAAGSNPGQDGYYMNAGGILIPYSYGGTGGGGSNSTTGGKGGNGLIPGAGGGGGGAGVTTGGRGGDGGPGRAVITCW